MTISVFIAVICAALLHAIWNALVKSGSDKYLSMAGVVLGHIPISILLLFIVPMPDLASWPYMLGSVVLHTGYQLVLINSYRLGDLTQVYPIARGSAPLLVAAVSVWYLGIDLKQLELLAVIVIGAGIMSMSLVRRDDGNRNGKATVFALITGCFIAAYSLNDGMGARLAQSALGFYAWTSLANAALFASIMAFKRPQIFNQLFTTGLKTFIIGGNTSFVAYALVLWAFTQAPIALVTALRETSIVFALVLGVFFLKEKFSFSKVFSTMTTLLGAALLRFS